MAEKQTILGRISQLAKANINALLDRAEDPQKMLDQLIRDYTNSIAEAETAVAQTVGNLRLAEKDHDEEGLACVFTPRGVRHHHRCMHSLTRRCHQDCEGAGRFHRIGIFLSSRCMWGR